MFTEILQMNKLEVPEAISVLKCLSKYQLTPRIGNIINSRKKYRRLT